MKMLAPFLLASAILLTACQPNVSPSQFSLPTQSTQSNTYSYQGVSVDTQKIPVKPTGELIQAKEITENMPGGSGIPTHYRINLGTEPLGERFNPIQPQILIYNTSQNTDTSTALKDLITQKPANPTYIPVAPLINATQVFRAHTKYLDFNNGSGVRFLTYYSQGINPITNSDLFYTYQGLTSDGKYRISVYYPISSNQLPNNTQAVPEASNMDQFAKNYKQYVSDTEAKLNRAPSDTFSPSLDKLDEIIKSLKVNPSNL